MVARRLAAGSPRPVLWGSAFWSVHTSSGRRDTRGPVVPHHLRVRPVVFRRREVTRVRVVAIQMLHVFLPGRAGARVAKGVRSPAEEHGGEHMLGRPAPSRWKEQSRAIANVRHSRTTIVNRVQYGNGPVQINWKT